MSVTIASTRVTIYCPSQDIPSARLHQPSGWSPSWTGEAPVETLEEIYLYFNRADDHDIHRLNRCGHNLPSLSVGDIIIRQLPAGARYDIVSHLGFKQIEQKQYLAIRRARDPLRAALHHVASHS